MDPVRLQLLLAVLVVGPAHFVYASWLRKPTPEAFEGDVISTEENPERYPWHIVQTRPGDRYPSENWNKKVKLVRCLENERNRFKLSCGKMDTDGEIRYRAILRDYEKNKPLLTLNVKSCEDNLLKSVSVVRSDVWWLQYEFYIINKKKSCEGYSYHNKMHWYAISSWTVRRYYSFDKSCPDASLRVERTNSDTFINGWKEIALPENPENCK